MDGRITGPRQVFPCWRVGHGDLRDTNIICDGERFYLIDFDWGGKLGEACYPVEFHELNPELVQGRSSRNALITAEDDDRVLETTMNKVKDRLPISGIERGDGISWDDIGI